MRTYFPKWIFHGTIVQSVGTCFYGQAIVVRFWDLYNSTVVLIVDFDKIELWFFYYYIIRNKVTTAAAAL